MADIVARRTFDRDAQARFAEASGDRNPLHLDSLAARRTAAGDVVVHGMHAALWALDVAFARGIVMKAVTRLRARFAKFIYTDAETTVSAVRSDEHGVRLEVWSGSLKCVILDLEFDARAAASDTGFERALPAEPLSQAPRELAPEALATQSGAFALVDPDALARLVPHVAARLGVQTLREVAGLSPLVGMLCPGLHSIFAGFDLVIGANARFSINTLHYRVTRFDERFRQVEIALLGATIAGSIEAFARYAPVAQRTLDEVRALVAPDEFAGTTALVAGGSRGIGAACARILVAGGARVVITYARGKGEADDLARELGPDAVHVVQYDVREPVAPQLAGIPWPLDHAYYFASPPIFRQKAALFETARFAEAIAFYVDGFAALCDLLRDRAPACLTFYPSTVAVEPATMPKDLLEYAMAKAAGEAYCAGINRLRKGRILVERLPRIATDQTASLVPAEAADATVVMLPIVRAMHRQRERH